MPRIEGRVDVECTLERAWELFQRFEDVARLIPSVEDVEVKGDRVHARVSVKLGALPITSRVVLEVTERQHMQCLKAVGVSYLGETVATQLAKGPLSEIKSDSVGRLDLHLDLRPGAREGTIAVIYEAEVEAEGRLKRIYESILKTKAPAMMREFAENIRRELEAPIAARGDSRAGEKTSGRIGPEIAPSRLHVDGPSSSAEAPARAPRPETPRHRGLLERLVNAFLARLLRFLEGRR